MDKKSNKRNNAMSGNNYASHEGNSQKKSKKKAGKTNVIPQDTKGIDWDLYEDLYASTGFSKQFGKGDNKSKSKSTLPGRTLKMKSSKKEDKGVASQNSASKVRMSSEHQDRIGSKQTSGKAAAKTSGKISGRMKEQAQCKANEQAADKASGFVSGKASGKTAGKIGGKATDGKEKSYDKANSRGNSNVDRSSKSRDVQVRNQIPKTTASGEPICPVYKKCGGCQLQGIEYSKQLARKQIMVEDLLGKFGKVEPIIGMENPYYYRNKIHAVFDRDRRGNYISGIYEEGSHEVVAVEDCLIQNKKANEIVNSIRGLLKSFKIKTYDEDTGYGLLRRVLIRTGYHSGEVMVVLVLGSPILPSKNNFVKALRKLHPEITTIVINVNNKQTSMILGDKEATIYGKGYIEDTLCGCKFRISPKSFYQINPVQTEVLYNTAIQLAELNGKQKVIDAYCGIGTIGMIASKHAKEVIGVELNSDAVKDANANAKLNGINNISFYNNDAGRFMVEMAEHNEHADVVFMDPPRAGSDEAFMDSVAKLNPKTVVYISCNPETLARDLEYMVKKGYKVKRMIPVDMFAFTNHVETVVLLSKKA